MPREDMEPEFIDCATLQAHGLWNCARCCPHCHSHPPVCDDADDAVAMNVGPGGNPGSVRLELCCQAGPKLDLTDPRVAAMIGSRLIKVAHF
jgi:hypothetical protein